MAYERINWQNEPSEATALNDVNLNKMDSAIYDHDQRLDTAESDIGNIETALDNKVDKVNGKGLSQVDNVTVTQHAAYGTVVSTIKTYKQDGTEVTSQVCNGIVVDSALSNSSTNPVQNKVVKSAIDEKSTVAISDTLETGTTLANITIDGTTTAIKGSDIEVDEELSPTSTNPVENKAIYDALNNLLPSKTVSGNPISISDASGFDAKALTVSMNPIQDLHGQGAPYPAGGGKNKSSVNSVSGVAWAISNADLKNAFNSLQNGTYTISFNIKVKTVTSTGEWIYGFMAQNPDESISKMNTVTTDATVGDEGSIVQTFAITDSNRGAFTNVNLYGCGSWATGAKGTADVSNIQIELGNQATPFSPYENICPISGRTEASVTRTGKNLFSYDELPIINGYFNGSHQFVGTNEVIPKSSANGWQSVKVKVKGYTQITISGMQAQGSVLCEYTADDTMTPISGSSFGSVNKNGTHTVPSNAKWLYLGINNMAGAGSTDYPNAQLELGSTATAYEPYTAETHTHQYSETIYGGVDDFVNGGATSTMVMVDLGSLTWTYDGTYNRFSSNGILDAKVPQTARSAAFLCSCYEVISDSRPISQVTNNSIYQAYGGGGAYMTISIHDDRFTDPVDLINAISGQTATYKLKTPTTISTSAEEITLLKGENVLSTNADDMELKYSVSLDSLLTT